MLMRVHPKQCLYIQQAARGNVLLRAAFPLRGLITKVSRALNQKCSRVKHYQWLLTLCWRTTSRFFAALPWLSFASRRVLRVFWKRMQLRRFVDTKNETIRCQQWRIFTHRCIYKVWFLCLRGLNSAWCFLHVKPLHIVWTGSWKGSLVYFHPRWINRWWGIGLPIKHRPFPSSSSKVTKQIFHWLRFGPKQTSNQKDHFLTGQISKGVPLGCVWSPGLLNANRNINFFLFFLFYKGVMLMRCQLTFKPSEARTVPRKYTKRTENQGRESFYWEDQWNLNAESREEKNTVEST